MLDGVLLGEVHDVDRRLVGRHQLLERLRQRRQRPGEGQRHRPLGVRDQRGLAAVAPGHVGGELGDVAEGGRHQHELRLRQLDQRHLPGPAAVGLGVEVELVHHHEPDVGRRALAQRDVGQDLGGAADDRRVGVDRGVTGQHPDVLGTEDLAELEELLADQRLDRRRVVGDLVLGQRRRVGGHGDQRLAGTGGRGQHDVAARRAARSPPRPGAGRAPARRAAAQSTTAAYTSSGLSPALTSRRGISRGREGARWRTPRAGCRR